MRERKCKRVVIIGASRGIGRATALLLGARGDSLLLVARDRCALESVAREVVAAGGRAEVVVADVTDAESVEQAARAIEAGGGCDVLINNAATCKRSGFLSHDELSMRAEFELNYWGPLRVTRALLPGMLRRGSGLIVNVSSLLGVVAAPTTANYSASKAALGAFTHALRGEVERHGVRVALFIAPHTDTDLGRQIKFDGVPSLPVPYTARELVRTVERAPRQYAGSPVYRILLRLAGLFPALIERRVAASVPRACLP